MKTSSSNAMVDLMWQHIDQLLTSLKPVESLASQTSSVIFYDKDKLRAKEFYFSCKVPNFHPFILQRMQNILGVERGVREEDLRTKVIYIRKELDWKEKVALQSTIAEEELINDLRGNITSMVGNLMRPLSSSRPYFSLSLVLA